MVDMARRRRIRRKSVRATLGLIGAGAVAACAKQVESGMMETGIASICVGFVIIAVAKFL